MLANIIKRTIGFNFSTIKIPIETLKKLRQQTSAPMGQCKKALQQSDGVHQKAILWLKQKGLMSAEKRVDKQTREGVVAAFISDCKRKAVLLQVNCQTDFVAKNDMFLKFVDSFGHRVLQNEEGCTIQEKSEQQTKNAFDTYLKSQSALNIFPQDKSLANVSEEVKLLISRLQENIRIRRVVTLHSDHGRFGQYVHRTYQNGIGLQACVVQASVHPQIQEGNVQEQQIVSEFADNIATQILGSPPKYLKAEQIPMELIQQQAQKVRQQMAQTLSKAPEHTHQKIISGKLNANFYSQCFLPSMNYILSNDGIPVSQYWQQVQRDLSKEIVIESCKIWQCK